MLAVLAVVSLVMFAAPYILVAPTTPSDTRAMTDVQMTQGLMALTQTAAGPEGRLSAALAARTRASPGLEVALVLAGEQNSSTMEGARLEMLTAQGSEGTMAGLALT